MNLFQIFFIVAQIVNVLLVVNAFPHGKYKSLFVFVQFKIQFISKSIQFKF